MSTDAAELHRRRKILIGHLGREISLKREHRRLRDGTYAEPAVLEDIRRTRALIKFSNLDDSPAWLCNALGMKTPPPAKFGVSGSWLVPIEEILLPYSTEPDPKQISLF